MVTGFPTDRASFTARRTAAVAVRHELDRRIHAIALRLGVVVGLLGALLGALVSLLAIVPLAVVAGVAGYLVSRSRARGALERETTASLRAIDAGPGADRLDNIVENLALCVGVAAPTLVVVPGDAPNAATIVAADGASIVVTEALATWTDVVALEGVVARQLQFLDGGLAHAAAWHDALDALPEARLVPGPAPVTELDGVPLVFAADCRAVQITRYPPGLAAALARCVDAPPLDGLTTRLDALALVPTVADVDVADRADALGEL